MLVRPLGGQMMHRMRHGFIAAVLVIAVESIGAQGGTSLAGSCARDDRPDLETVEGAPEVLPVLQGPGPRTPRFALRDGYRGRVVLAVIVDTLGRAEVSGATVVAVTDAGLREWACGYVRQLRFTPARLGDRPVRAQAVIPFEFSATIMRRW